MGGELSEVCYAVDERGRYVIAPSLGWEPKTIANTQAWERVQEKAEEALGRVRAGESSPLLFHMTLHQMSVGLLARYVRLFRWQVRRHLTPKGYSRMSPAHKNRYAEVFETTPQALDRLPDKVRLVPDAHERRD